MIEVLDPATCTSCNICVRVCPMNVFEKSEAGIPIIARQNDCQTCYMCEVYCPEDALYVHPDADKITGMTLDEARATGMMGSYRRIIGWSPETRDMRATDASYLILTRG